MSIWIAILLFFCYIETSVIWNHIAILNSKRNSIRHWPEDIFQVVFMICICIFVDGFTLQGLILAGFFLSSYWLLFDLQLNLVRGLPIDYRSTAWYDNLLPENRYLYFGIKILLIVMFIILYNLNI